MYTFTFGVDETCEGGNCSQSTRLIFTGEKALKTTIEISYCRSSLGGNVGCVRGVYAMFGFVRYAVDSDT